MMPVLITIAAFLKGGLGWLWEFLSSHFGQLVAVFLVAWFWNGHRVNAQWEARVAEEKAAAASAYRAEVARQESAAREIAAAATTRLVEEQALAASLKAEIAALDKEETADAPPLPNCSPAVIRPCRVDGAFAKRVQHFDAIARKAAPARRAR